MGKGDRRSRKGKIWRGTSGVSRLKKGKKTKPAGKK
jgi:ribosomal small subunit protein bTHX